VRTHFKVRLLSLDRLTPLRLFFLMSGADFQHYDLINRMEVAALQSSVNYYDLTPGDGTPAFNSGVLAVLPGLFSERLSRPAASSLSPPRPVS